MKILITGGSGLLGQYLNIELSRDHFIMSLYNKNPGNCKNYNSREIDISDKKALQEIFNSFKPEIVLHTAAVSNPGLASSIDSKIVYDINVYATKNLAELCQETKTRLIYTSTDLVYAGYRGSMLKENAKLIPVSLYAETKLMGEVKIKETFDNYLILRLALLYGFGLNQSYSHFHQMYLNLKNDIYVKLFTDQFRSPLELKNAAEIIDQLIKKDISGETINLGGKERVSRYQLGEILCKIAGFDKKLLLPITMDEITDLARVVDVSMDTDRLQSYGIKQNSIEESIIRILSVTN